MAWRADPVFEANAHGGNGEPEERADGRGNGQAFPSQAVIEAATGVIGGGKAGQIEDVHASQDVSKQPLPMVGSMKRRDEKLGEHNE